MRTIGFLLRPDFSPMGLGTAAAFDMANKRADKKVYDVVMLSDAGGLVRGALGMSVETEALSERPLDLLIIVGGPCGSGAEPMKPATIAFLREAVGRVSRIAAVCAAAFTLAEAGLLDGRRATTHWR
jgi:transcriptional regulator GlxA family with amidase domain